MRKHDTVILALGIIITILWTVVSGKDGFKGNNATIIARSIAITATIDGQIENNPPPVGTWVNSNDLLARVHNSRFDHSRLMELESQSANLTAEIGNITQQLQSIEQLRSQFEQRTTAHANWVVSDLELKPEEFKAQLDVARAQSRLESKEAHRAQELYNKNLISQVDMQIASTQAEIAGKQLDVNKAQWERSGLMLHTWKKSGVLLEDGDASYWDKMTDTRRLQHFESTNRLAMLETQLIQVETQAQVEKARISSSFIEEHHAPFAGKVNARFVTQSTRVNSGTDLLQLLDCTNPVVIIPVPDHRISDFSVV